MKLGLAIAEVERAERELAAELLKVGERHRTDHDVYHLSRTLAQMCDRHLAALATVGERNGHEVEAEPGGERSGPLAAAREKGAELLGRRSEPGVALLRDLRRLHLLAADASIAWVVLGQAAQAARDAELLGVVSACHPETLRQLRWTTARLKEAAPQVLMG